MSDTEWIKKGKTRKSGPPKGGLDPKQKKKIKTINVGSAIENIALDETNDGKIKTVIIKDGILKNTNEFKSGGRAGFKVGGAAKRGISKILRKK